MYPAAAQGCSPDAPMCPAGAVSDCVNLRFNGTDMEAPGTPRILLYTEGKPLLADMMNGHHYLFTQIDDGTLYYQRLTDDELFLPLVKRELGRVTQDVLGAVSAGDFIIMLLADSTLMYARRDVANEGYLWLGALPALPAFGIRAVEGPAVTVSMKGVKFASPLTDISGAVPEQVSAPVARAWHEAHTRLIDTLHTSGQWTAPVDVRLALRLWDGTLLQVSAPVRLTPADAAGSSRINAGLLWDETKKRFTGTDDTSLTGRGFTIAVQTDEPLPSVWSGLVSGMEAWVSREPDLVEAATPPRLAYISNASGNYLSLTPVMRSSAAVQAEANKAPAGRHSLLEEDAALSVLQYSADVVYDSALSSYLTSMPGTGTLKADCILAHDGFLHVGSCESLYTSRPGNPLVVASHTDGLGAPVRALTAQTTGGGAYTRQYIYAATERGIVAVTHRADGVHTNARSVCREPLGTAPVWCATPHGVYALTCTGSLICLRDAKAPTLFTRLKNIRSMLWSHAYGELWLCGGSASLILSPAMNYAAYRRTCSLMPLPTPCAPTLAWSEDATGTVRILCPEQELPRTETASYSMCASLPAGPATSPSAVDLFMSGSRVNWSITDCFGRVLGALKDAPLQQDMLRMPLPKVLARPCTLKARSELYLKIEGEIESLNSFIVYNY